MPWFMIAMERWETRADERVCGQCGPKHGQLYEQGKGPQPPLHYGCRCRRVYSHIKYTQEEPRAD